MNRYRYTDKGRVHLHELDKEDGMGYKPLIGTTTAINEVYPPPLAWYGSAKALERLGWITEKKEPDARKREELLAKGHGQCILAADMNMEDYHTFLEECYKNHDEYKRAKGKEGTDVHALIEEYIKMCLENGGTVISTDAHLYDPSIVSFVKWANQDVLRFLWSEAHCFSDKLWLGGICDFGFIHKNSKVIVADNKPSVYPKHFIQTALYGIQIKENGLWKADGTVQNIVYQPLPENGNGCIKIDGYCIFDYNKGQAWYRTDVDLLERVGVQTVELYKNKDVIGTNTL